MVALDRVNLFWTKKFLNFGSSKAFSALIRSWFLQIKYTPSKMIFGYAHVINMLISWHPTIYKEMAVITIVTFKNVDTLKPFCLYVVRHFCWSATTSWAFRHPTFGGSIVSFSKSV